MWILWVELVIVGISLIEAITLTVRADKRKGKGYLLIIIALIAVDLARRALVAAAGL